MESLPRSQTAFCVVGCKVVCLDLERDRYFCLRGASNDALRAVAEGRSATNEQLAIINDLERRGIVRGAFGEQRFLEIGPVRRSLLDGALVRPTVVDHLAFTLAFMKARYELAHGLEGALGRAATLRRNLAQRGSDPKISHRVAWVHHGVTPLFRSHDRCLIRSLALQRHLAQLKQDSRLVLGVALRPFRAHCWVQQGDLVLNDSYDSVRAFTPIFAI